jgi:hypothetical protein
VVEVVAGRGALSKPGEESVEAVVAESRVRVDAALEPATVDGSSEPGGLSSALLAPAYGTSPCARYGNFDRGFAWCGLVLVALIAFVALAARTKAGAGRSWRLAR